MLHEILELRARKKVIKEQINDLIEESKKIHGGIMTRILAFTRHDLDISSEIKLYCSKNLRQHCRKSPHGVCVFDMTNDEWFQSCLYCGCSINCNCEKEEKALEGHSE